MGSLIFRIQCRLYSLLERPSGSWHIIYHLGIFAYVLLTLSLSAIMTLEEDSDNPTVVEKFVFAMEMSMAVYFTIEFSLRMFCIGINAKYKGWRGRLRYMCGFIVIIDILILIATYGLLFMGTKNGKFLGSSAVQNLRFLQILRMLHVDRDASSWKMMENIFHMHKAELIAAYYLSAVGLLVMSTLVYLIEDSNDKLHPEQTATFDNYGDAIWWGIITIMAVGYGDIVPKTWLSKLVTVIFALLCVSLFMLVSSVIGVGLTLSVQERDRRKKLSKQLPLAASVIQTYYRQRLILNKYNDIHHYKTKMSHCLLEHEIRCAAMSAKHADASTRHHNHQHIRSAIKMSKQAIRKTSIGINHLLNNNSHTIHEEHECGPEEHLNEVPNLFSRAAKVTSTSTTVCEYELGALGDSDYCSSNSSPGPESTYHVQDTISSCPPTALFSDIANNHLNNSADSATHSQADCLPMILDIPVSAACKYQAVLLAVTRFSFLGAKKRFKIARKPYDLQDVSAQQSECEMQQLQRLKEVQHRLEMLVGKPGLSLLTKSKKELALSNRIELVECRTSETDRKVDLVLHLATQLSDRLTYYEAMHSNNQNSYYEHQGQDQQQQEDTQD